MIKKVDLSELKTMENTVTPVGSLIAKIVAGAGCGVTCGGAGCGGWCGGAACAGW